MSNGSAARMLKFTWVFVVAFGAVLVMYGLDVRRGDRLALVKAVAMAVVVAIAGVLAVIYAPH
jgi:hypothetical protein